MTCTNEASTAFFEVQRKVTELQDAIIKLNSTVEFKAVDIQDWMNDMDTMLDSIAEEMFE